MAFCDGQARKSLWIETFTLRSARTTSTVRLVRACGSKHSPFNSFAQLLLGQARKSLWIETAAMLATAATPVGQARKSLWIETFPFVL